MAIEGQSHRDGYIYCIERSGETKEPRKKILGDLNIHTFKAWPTDAKILEIRWCEMSDGSYHHTLQFKSEEQVDAFIAELIKKKEFFSSNEEKESEHA